MDGFNEKKWFVYLTDHHEGPFSLAEIQAKMAQSQVTVSNFVWAEGMPDWRPMTEIPEFESILSATPALGTAAATQVASTLTTEPVLAVAESASVTTEAAPVLSSAPVAQEEKTGDLDPAELKRATELHEPAQAGNEQALASTESKKAPKRSHSRAIRWALAGLVPVGLAGAYAQGYLDPVIHSPALHAGIKTVTDVAQPQLVKVVDKFPALGKWISPIQSLEDVSQDDYEILKFAALQKLEEAGPKIAVAVSKADEFAPSFYVATNLPDGTVIDLYIEGISDTLLNQLSFNTKAQATIDKRLGKTAPIRFQDGKPVPRGEYIVYATEGQQQPEPAKTILSNIPPVTAKVPPGLPRGLKLLVSKPYFLGGAKDATYEARLKEFHDKLRAKASAELSEIKQFATTLESQLSTSVSKFKAFRGSGRRPGNRKAWQAFNKQWTSLNEQLTQSYAKWTPEALQSEYFYGVLYTLTQQAGKAVEQVHAIHQSHFDGKSGDPKAFDIQQGTALSVAQTSLTALKNKIDQAEKLAPSPNGMPRREGL